MKFSAQLDVNVVAHETDDEVAVLLDLTAPGAPESENDRTGTSMQVVLDRSGSMGGAPLAGALSALTALVERLDAQDTFGLVVFDNGADVVVPAGPVMDKTRITERIRTVQAGGMTDLSAGYLRGLQELRRVSGAAGGTLLVVSDGHANQGLTDPDRFGDLARRAHQDRIVTSTVGYGLGYDESLLAAVARGGSGNHHFAMDPDAAGAAIASEVTGLLSKSVQAATLMIGFEPSVELVRLYNDLPSTQLGSGQVMVELGDFYVDEERRLLLRFHVPAMARLGLSQIATLELRYVELPDLVEQLVTLPITVNVVPGDAAAGRVPDPTVHTEVLFQEAQHTKRLASESLERGDRATARRLLDEAARSLESAGVSAPDDLRADLDREVGEMRSLESQVFDLDPRYSSKVTRASYHRHNRKRGRHGEDA